MPVRKKKCIPPSVTIPATLAHRVTTWPGGLRQDWEGGESGIWCVGDAKIPSPSSSSFLLCQSSNPRFRNFFLEYFLYWISNARQLYFGGGEEKHFVSRLTLSFEKQEHISFKCLIKKQDFHSWRGEIAGSFLQKKLPILFSIVSRIRQTHPNKKMNAFGAKTAVMRLFSEKKNS